LVVQNVMPFEWIPVATSAIQFAQTFGGALFTAVAQAVFQNGLVQGIERDAPGLPAEIFINSGASQVRQILQSLHAEQYTEVVLTAYLQGLRNSYYVTVACGAVAFLGACGLSWKKIQKHQDDDKEPAEKTPVEAEKKPAVDPEV